MVKIFFMSDRKDFLYICGLWIWIWLSYSFDIITSPSCLLLLLPPFLAAEHGHSFFSPLRLVFSIRRNERQQRSFLSSCLKFLNISPSTAVAVRDDLKTAQKGRFDTWFICNRLTLPNLSPRLPIKQPRQIDLRKGNSGGRYQWSGC